MRVQANVEHRGGDGDDWVEKEFKKLLLYLWIYNKLWSVFDDIDTGDDRRVDLDEFKVAAGRLHLFLQTQMPRLSSAQSIKMEEARFCLTNSANTASHTSQGAPRKGASLRRR